VKNPVAPPEFAWDDIPIPQPGAGEVLVRVHAAGVTPTEVQWYTTTHGKSGAPRSDAVPGHEFSGVVDAVGSDTSGVTIGQAVFGMNDWFADGATAEYCLTRSEWIAPRSRADCRSRKPPRRPSAP
jgi:NADPH:quinone reductase-like Zn-dependent oxidoreductase